MTFISPYTVQKNVELPPDGRGKYPWEEMESGDSFFVYEPSDAKAKTTATRVTNAGRLWISNNRPGWSVVSRQESDGVSIGVRVWIFAPEE